MKEFWNKRYSQEEMIYGTEPNVFFREQLRNLRPGSLLLPAEGEGRNSVFAALKGWQVQVFDYSEAGRDKALKLAEQRNVSINYQLSEVNTFTWQHESLDAVALIYAHFPPDLRLILHTRLQEWLKPGGVLILEAFHPEQLKYSSGGPKEAAMLYTADMLRTDFPKLEIQTLQEEEIILEEGSYHQGTAYVTRLVAKKPLLFSLQD